MAADTLRDLIWDNPMNLEATRVVRRFFRTGGATGKGVNIAVGLLIGFLYLYIVAALLRFRDDYSWPLLVFQLLAVTMALPLSMFGAVSGEREKLTWDALIMTRLRPGQIVAGKLIWRLMMLLGIMALFVPLLLLSEHYGQQKHGPDSLSRATIALIELLTFSWGLLLASFSLWLSSRTKRAVTTLSIATVCLLTFLALVPALVGVLGGRMEFQYSDSTIQSLGCVLVHANPFFALCKFADGFAGPPPERDMAWLITYMPLFYAVLSAALIAGTYRTLCGLEAPVRGGGGAGRAAK